MSFWGRLRMALRAFQEKMVVSGPYSEEDFADPESRKVRYDILWAQYESTIYRSVHPWAATLKTRYSLYRYIRSIYGSAYKIGEFWKAHLWGGALDAEAGNEGALPIVTDNEGLRPSIADIWEWSNWATKKDVVTLHGAVYGDVILRVVDSPELGKVYIQSVFPGTVTELIKDPFGHIKGYTLEEERAHPINGRPVTYKETAERAGQDVVYKTYLNDALFAWKGTRAQWSEPYGFVPMVHIQHNDVGLDWGWSELHPARSKMHELDDLASLLSDQIGKSVMGKWLFAGADPADLTTSMTTTETTARPEPGREEEASIAVPSSDVKAIPLVYPVDIEGAVLHITEIIKDFEREYPELGPDIMNASGDVSGRALRIARQPTETKVQQRRTNYDDGLKRTIQMALTIGGLRNTFPGITLDSFDSGALDFEFDERGVFAVDPVDEWEERKLFYEAAKMAKDAGLPLLVFLERNGWSEEDLDALRKEIEAQEPEPAPVIDIDEPFIEAGG